MSRLLIIGAGGYGRTVAEAAAITGKYSSIAFVDDSYEDGKTSGRYSIVGSSDNLAELTGSFDFAVAAIGNNRIRKEKTERLLAAGYSLATIIHPRTYVSIDAEIGEGTTIMAGAVVGPYAKIGRGCILNANATADHDSVMHDYAHLGVGVAIAGTSTLGEGAWLQAGCAAGYGVVIPKWEVVSNI